MKVEIIEHNRVFDRFFAIDEAKLSFERFDGTMSPVISRLNFERGEAVTALVYNTDNQKFIFVVQFRFPSYTKGEGWILELVAGMTKTDEDKEVAIRREILEEIGYQASSLKYLYNFFVSPGGSSEYVHLFFAEVCNQDKLEAGGGLWTEHEDIQIVEYSIDELKNMLNNGQIKDGKTIMAIQWFIINYELRISNYEFARSAKF